MVWTAPIASLFLWDQLNLGHKLGKIDHYLFQVKCPDEFPDCTDPDPAVCPPCGNLTDSALGETAPFYLSTASCYSPSPVYRLFSPMEHLHTTEAVQGTLLKIEQAMDYDYRAILNLTTEKRMADAQVEMGNKEAKHAVKRITKDQLVYERRFSEMRRERNLMIKEASERYHALDMEEMEKLAQVYKPGVRYTVQGNLTVGIDYVPPVYDPHSQEWSIVWGRSSTSEAGSWVTLAPNSTSTDTGTWVTVDPGTPTLSTDADETTTEFPSSTHTGNVYAYTAASTLVTSGTADGSTVEINPDLTAHLEPRKQKTLPFEEVSSRLNNLVPIPTWWHSVNGTWIDDSTKTRTTKTVTATSAPAPFRTHAA